MSAAVGEIGGVETVVLVQNFAFVGGSLGVAAGEAFIAAAEEAVKRDAPLVIFTASGGARMQEGALLADADGAHHARHPDAARRAPALRRGAHRPHLPAASPPPTPCWATSTWPSPAALIGFAGRRVIEQTIRETLPAGFQTAEFLVERGMVDRVVTRKELPAVLGSILRTLMMGAAPSAA